MGAGIEIPILIKHEENKGSVFLALCTTYKGSQCRVQLYTLYVCAKLLELSLESDKCAFFAGKLQVPGYSISPFAGVSGTQLFVLGFTEIHFIMLVISYQMRNRWKGQSDNIFQEV